MSKWLRSRAETKSTGSVLKIVQTGHPVLRQQAAALDPDWIGTEEFDKLVSDMVATMRDAPGVGLAAPQVGLSLRLFVIEDRQDEDEDDPREHRNVPLRVICNPTLEPVGDEKVEFFEGCLSVEGFAAVVSRWRRVKLTGLDESGAPIELEWSGWPARILQHEFDHTCGILYLDHMDTRTFASVDQVNSED